MSFGKSSAPSAPNYAPIAQADATAANNEYQLGEQQLQWGQQQFNTVWPYAQQYMSAQVTAANQENTNAQQAQQFYQSTYQPIETKFANQAQNYDTAANDTQREGQAEADVTNTFDANRNAALSNLESYGIDPSQTRYGALDLSTRVSQAAATAAAGTQSRLNSQATGLALEGEAINTGRGYPSSVAQAYSTAANAGLGGINAANSTINTGVNSMGSPTSYYGLGNNSMNNQASALNMGFNNALGSASLNTQIASNSAAGLGQLIGGGISAAALFL